MSPDAYATNFMSSLFEKNLAALNRRHPALAAQLQKVPPDADLTFSPSKEGDARSAVLTRVAADGSPKKTTLASRFRPLSEADRLADQIDVSENGLIVLLGFGLGYHVRAAMDRVVGKAAMVVYEPDEQLFRSVLEELDVSDLLAAEGLVLLVGDVDTAAMTAGIEKYAAMLAQGVQFITHPPTRQLHADTIKRFTEAFTDVAAYCRTTVATTLVNSRTTATNLVHNLGWYAAGESINALKDAARGKPAVLVAAGPSLAKNIALLRDAQVRRRVVVIAVQTVLKPLLDWGIRPDFVTALDYHEISRRFYDDLPDLPDVTLVAEPKANPVILQRFPGPVRVLRNSFLDTLLGVHRRELDALRAGSTVAHLSLYLAQHLGCDPIILTGQDLGFSDGLYYCPGTAIHDVWAPELSMFNTLETMEWKRIARHKRHLQKRTDVHDRPIYSDEQMLTYLAQFERDFAAAEQTIIDATEGGLPKQHTQPMPLSEALQRHATAELDPLPQPHRSLDPARLKIAREQLDLRRRQVRQLQQVTRRTLELLDKMLRDQRDANRMAAHFRELEKQQKRVAELDEVFTLVNTINQLAAYNRLRADRAIHIAQSSGEIDDHERQRRQLERDRTNLRWLDDSCEETARLLATPIATPPEPAADDSHVSEETLLRETAAAHPAGHDAGGDA